MHVLSSSLSADQTAVVSANASSCSTANNPASTSSNSVGWVEIACDPPNFPFNENVGLKTNLSSLTDFVDLFFLKELLQMLVKQTKLYASQTIAKQGPLRRNSRMKYWKETDVPEMKVFLGCCRWDHVLFLLCVHTEVHLFCMKSLYGHY